MSVRWLKFSGSSFPHFSLKPLSSLRCTVPVALLMMMFPKTFAHESSTKDGDALAGSEDDDESERDSGGSTEEATKRPERLSSGKKVRAEIAEKTETRCRRGAAIESRQ